MPVTSQRIANRLRAEMMHKVDRLPLNYYDNSSTGDIMSRITNDADNVGDQSSMTFVFLFSATTSIVGCILMMIYTNLILGLVAMVPPLAGFACMRMVVRKTQPLFVSQSRNLGAMNAHVEENYYGYGISRPTAGRRGPAGVSMRSTTASTTAPTSRGSSPTPSPRSWGSWATSVISWCASSVR